MRTRNALERLAASGRPLQAAADSLAGAGEEDWILERILASSRMESRPLAIRWLRPALVLAGAATVAAAVAVVVTGTFNDARPLAAEPGRTITSL